MQAIFPSIKEEAKVEYKSAKNGPCMQIELFSIIAALLVFYVPSESGEKVEFAMYSAVQHSDVQWK